MEIKKDEPLDNNEIKIGDLVEHPFTGEAVPILAKGNKVHQFIPRAYVETYKKNGQRIGSEEAIEGSDNYNGLKANSNFIDVNNFERPSYEIPHDMADLGIKIIVVPAYSVKLL